MSNTPPPPSPAGCGAQIGRESARGCFGCLVAVVALVAGWLAWANLH